MGKDVDIGDFYNIYNFMSVTSFMGFIAYIGYLWVAGGERGRCIHFTKDTQHT